MALRPLRVSDARAMATVLADPALYTFTGGEPSSAAELEKRYTRQVAGRSPDGTQEWINSIVLAGAPREPVGYVQATIPTDGGPAEIAWVVGTPWQGKGYATSAVRLLVDDLAGRGATRLVAHIHPEHEASQRIARSVGLAPTEAIVDGEVRWEGKQ